MKQLPDLLASEVKFPLDQDCLWGTLNVPEGASGIVLFAHGSGSSRYSPRNQFVAEVMHDYGFGTLLFDLLTLAEEEEDESSGEYRFDIPLLASRLIAATHWIRNQRAYAKLSIGYFGASTGAAAALVAAAELGSQVSAVVSRGGRPDLAGSNLFRVTSPTLLIVGGYDTEVLRMNQDALGRLTCEKALRIVPKATHLFVEQGALAQASRLAGEWFEKYLPLKPRGEGQLHPKIPANHPWR